MAKVMTVRREWVKQNGDTTIVVRLVGRSATAYRHGVSEHLILNFRVGGRFVRTWRRCHVPIDVLDRDFQVIR